MPVVDATLVVHILRAGRPLCARPGTPNEWPGDHRWIPWNNVPRHLAKHGAARYCQRCWARYMQDTDAQYHRRRIDRYQPRPHRSK